MFLMSEITAFKSNLDYNIAFSIKVLVGFHSYPLIDDVFNFSYCKMTKIGHAFTHDDNASLVMLETPERRQ